jgi:hypothetical protein
MGSPRGAGNRSWAASPRAAGDVSAAPQIFSYPQKRRHHLVMRGDSEKRRFELRLRGLSKGSSRCLYRQAIHRYLG